MKKYFLTFAVLVVFAIGFTASDDDEPKKFEAVEDGRAAYELISANYDKADIKRINKFVMYEGHSRRDCKAEGVNSEGRFFSEDGKWEKKSYSSGYFYYLDFKYFKLLVRDDSVVCYYKGSIDDEKAIQTSLQSNVIGKIRDLTPEGENKITQESLKTKEEQVPKKSKKDEIRELGFNDGVQFGYEDKGNYLREYIQMGLPLESAIERVKVVARLGYKENYGSDISEELLDEFAEKFMEGYKSVVVKK